MSFDVEIGHASRRGTREHNEDFAGALREPGRGLVAAIADGVSSGGRGREAAQTTVMSLLADFFGAPATWETTVVFDRLVGAQQDPYPTPGHAHGYAFSVPKHIKPIPKSLQNIFKELVDDLGCDYPKHGELTYWAKHGVMLLNTCISVEPWKPGSHKGWGWEQLTREVICTLVEQTKHKVFILWGKQAQSYADYIDSDHLVLKAPHPSPLAAHLGFFGSKPFSQTNKYLAEHGIEPIIWGTYGQASTHPSSASSRSHQQDVQNRELRSRRGTERSGQW